jgi:hypothetical protein
VIHADGELALVLGLYVPAGQATSLDAPFAVT